MGRDWLSLTFFSHAGHEPLHTFPTAPPCPIQTSMAGSCTVTRQRPETGNRHVAFPESQED
jgi:hypothetical protein